ncbi:unnamed protein product [Closterium sp. NIES-53]
MRLTVFQLTTALDIKHMLRLYSLPTLLTHLSVHLRAAASLIVTDRLKAILKDPAMVLVSAGGSREDWICVQDACEKAHGSSFELATAHAASIRHKTNRAKAGAATRVSKGALSVATLKEGCSWRYHGSRGRQSQMWEERRQQFTHTRHPHTLSPTAAPAAGGWRRSGGAGGWAGAADPLPPTAALVAGEWRRKVGGGRGGLVLQIPSPRRVGSGGGQRKQQQRRSETPSPQQLRGWFLHGASGGSCSYVICTGDGAGQTCGRLHTQHRCFSRLDDAWRAEFGDDVELPRWADLLKSRIAIFDLDFDAILSAMYALSVSADGDNYRCVPPDPGIAAAALGASESGNLPGTAPTEALHTFTLDSGASSCVRVRSGSRLLLVSPPVAPDSSVAPPPGSTLSAMPSWHAHSSSCFWSRSLPPLPPSPAPPCLPCVEGRQRATPHSSSFPPTTAPLQFLHKDVWRPARVSGQSRERYFLLQNGIAEHRIGLVMEVARTSMIHAAAPHFLWPFAIRYAAHQFNLWPRVSLLETSPTLRWTGEVGNASVFRVWGSRAFVCDTSADKLPPRAIPCVFLGFVPDAPCWQFYHPTLRRVLPSQDVTFDESVPFYHLFPYRSAPPPTPPLFLAPAVGSGAAPGAASGGAEPGGAESEGAETGGAEPGGVGTGGGEPRGAEHEGVEPGGAVSEGAESGGATSSGGSASASPRLSPQQLREWFVRRAHLRSGATGAGGVGAAGAGGAGVATGAGVPRGTAATGPGAAHTRGTGVAGTGGVKCAGAQDSTEPGAASAGGAGAGGAGVGGPGAGGAGAAGAGVGGTGAGGVGTAGAGAVDLSAGGAGGTMRPRPYFSGGLTQRREPASRPVLLVHTARRAPRSRPRPVSGTHAMALRPSSVPMRVPLPTPPESSLPEATDTESDRARAASPAVSRLFATAVTYPSFESAAASALVAELLDFAAACRLDYATALVAESVSASPSSVGGECALGTDVLEDRQEDFECLVAAVPRFASMLLAPEGDSDAPDIPTPRSYAEAITGPYSSQWQAAMDAEMASCLLQPVYGLHQAPREWHDTLKTTHVALGFAPSTADPSLFLRTDMLLPPFYDLVFVDDLVFATADTEALTLVKSSFSASASSSPRHSPLLCLPAIRSYAEAITGPYSSKWQAAMDAEMASWKVKRPRGSPPAFKARYVARGFSQRQGVDYFQTFSPTLKMTALRVFLHVATQRDYELHSLDFSTAFLQGSLHEEIWLRRPPGFYGSFPAGTQWSLRQPDYGLRQAPRKWHDTLKCTLVALGFAPSTADPSLFLRTDTSLPPFYVLVLQRFGFQLSSALPTPLSTGHSLSAPPSDESVESSGRYPELVGCLMYLMTCTRPDLAYPLSLLARYVAPVRHRKMHWDAAKRVLHYLYSTSCMWLVLGGQGPVVLTGHADAFCVDDSATQPSSQGYTFNLGSSSGSRQSTHSCSVLSSSCEAAIYAGAMAAQELRWLMTDLGEQPRSPPVLYVDNKAMIALCREHRQEHRTKHITLRYFLARELQQRGQLRLAYVVTRANTADVFTKALQSGDHQRFSTVLGLVPTLPHLLTA